MVSARAMEDRIGSRMGPWRQRPWRGDVGALSEAVNKSDLPHSLSGGKQWECGGLCSLSNSWNSPYAERRLDVYH